MNLTANTIVNAESKKFDGVFKATILKVNKNGTVRVQYADGNEETLSAKMISERKRGRKPIEQQFSEAEIVEQIDELQADLEAALESGDVREQKRIRRKLRRRGHVGGLMGEGSVTVVSKKLHDSMTA